MKLFKNKAKAELFFRLWAKHNGVLLLNQSAVWTNWLNEWTHSLIYIDLPPPTGDFKFLFKVYYFPFLQNVLYTSDSQFRSCHCSAHFVYLSYLTHSVQFMELSCNELMIWIRCVK